MRPGRLLAVFFCGACSLAAPFDYSAFLQQVRVPDGFEITLAAGDPTLRFPMFACLDDVGRLYVAESSGKDLYAGLKNLTRDCRVSRLEDRDGDGVYEAATVFADRVTFPMGLAWRDGRLFLADPPDLVALTDLDGDGRADKREVILSGFGHTDNGSLHGLTFGPDGMLYFTMGTPDGWRLPRGDGTFLEGVAGALFRCKADGSELEVISRGFENLVEVEFLPGGEIIGTDNWYQRPAGGMRDALVDCAPGGLFPYAPDRGTPLPRTGIVLPPVILLPAVAHSGLVRMRGKAFPAEWAESLFVAEHNTRKVVRQELQRDGSTFTSRSVEFAVGEHPDFHPADVLEDRDGSLLILDTGGWYVEHCPTGRIRDSRAPGGIFRVRWKDGPKVARAATETESRLMRIWSESSLGELRSAMQSTEPTVACAAIRVLGLRRDRESAAQLGQMLRSSEPFIRRAAAEALARCGSKEQALLLLQALAKAGDLFEEHACIAGILALADEAFVRAMLRHESVGVRRAALFLLDQPPFGTLRFADLVEPLGASEERLRGAALELLQRHRAWAREARPWLQEQLAGGSFAANEPAVANILASFQKDKGVRETISQFLGDGSVPTRRFLLGLLPRLSELPPEAEWLKAAEEALDHENLRAVAVGAAATWRNSRFETKLAAISSNARVPTLERLHAARASSRSELPDIVFDLALQQLQGSGPERLAAEDLLVRATLSDGQERWLLETLRAEPRIALEPLMPVLVRSASEKTRGLTTNFFAQRLQSGWSPARGTLEQILSLYPANAQERAELLAQWKRNQAAAFAKLQNLKPLLNRGDADRGREVFALACASCHRVGETGGNLGPDLTKIGAIRSGDDLLESILFPSSTFAQGYEPYLLKVKNGEELSGSVISQDAETVRFRDAIGATREFRATDIASLERQELSLMPAGLDETLSKEQLADLMSYLASLR